MSKFSSLRYNSKARWMSYWYQITEALEISPKNVLVIGKGSGITENAIRILSENRTSVTTLDIDETLKPDVVGSVTELPFEEDSFDVIMCCQVLEHLPFEQFPLALRELHRVSRKRVVLSVPHGRKFLKFSLNTPFGGEKTIIIKHPFTKKTISSRQHHWEICRTVSRRQVVAQIEKYFRLEKEFLNEVNCNHRFFILEKK